MTQTPTLIVRKDLNMTKGKICSQVSHALNYMILGCLTTTYTQSRINSESYANAHKDQNNTEAGKSDPVNSDCLLMPKAAFDFFAHWITELDCNMNIQWAEDLEDLESKLESVHDSLVYRVYDQGRTMFKGETTQTVALIAPDTLAKSNIPIEIKAPPMSDEPKQAIIVRRRPRLGSLQMAYFAGKASMLQLLRHFEETCDGSATLVLSDKPELKTWLANSSAKITLGVKTADEIEDIILDADGKDLYASIVFDGKGEDDGDGLTRAIALGPRKRSVVDEITKSLKLV